MSAGCDDITGPLLDFDPGHGCPSTCRAIHSKQLASIRCTDVSPDDPKLKALAANYKKRFRIGSRKELVTGVDTFGCAAFNDYRDVPGAWTNNEPHCEFGTPGVKSLLTLCPVTCGCVQKKGSIQCPTTCSNNSAH